METLNLTEDELGSLYRALAHARQAYRTYIANSSSPRDARVFVAFDEANDKLLTRVGDLLNQDDGSSYQSRGGREDFHSDT